MRIPFLTFGAIASFLTLNAFADTTSTVTSKNYVDAADALKQNKIPAAGTNASTPGNTVVTYTQTGNGVIGERGIFDPETDWDNENGEIVSGHETDLVSAGTIFPVVAEMANRLDDIPEMTETNAVYTNCAGSDESTGECLLWNLDGRIVYGPDGTSYNRPGGKVSNCVLEGNYCSSNDSCCSGLCGVNNRCAVRME